MIMMYVLLLTQKMKRWLTYIKQDKSYLEPLALVLVGVFFFFFIEKILLLILGKESTLTHVQLCHHSAHSNRCMPTLVQHGHGLQHGHNTASSSEDEIELEDGKGEESEKKDTEKSDEIDDDLPIQTGFQGRIRRFGSNQAQLMKTVKTFGWLNLISDGTCPRAPLVRYKVVTSASVFHNFVDGLAIGSAYSQSLSMGMRLRRSSTYCVSSTNAAIRTEYQPCCRLP